MRIAVNGRFLAARTTGVQRVAREVVAALTRTADVTVLTPRGVAHTGAGTAASGWTRGVVWEQLELPLRRGLGDYDVALDPANAGPLLGGRRILVLSDAFPLTHPEWYGPAFRRWFRLVVAPAARRAERVIMFSRWAREQAITAMGLDADRVVIATQGTAPFHEPAPRPRVDTVRARLGLSSPYLLATGVGDARKNVPFLRQVLDRLRDEYRANPALALTGAPYPYVHAGTPPPGRGRLPPPRARLRRRAPRPLHGRGSVLLPVPGRGLRPPAARGHGLRDPGGGRRLRLRP